MTNVQLLIMKSSNEKHALAEQTLETVKGSEQQETRFSEVISGGNVELLKKAFGKQFQSHQSTKKSPYSGKK